MPRRKFSDGVEAKYEDLNAITYALERQFYDRIIRQMVSNDVTGFWKSGFLVSRTDSDTISVAAGIGIQIDNTQISPQAEGRPVVSLAAQSLDITAPDGSNDRIDIVVTKSDLVNEISEDRRFKDEDTDVITEESTWVQEDWSNDTMIVEGTPAGSPVAPAVPSGYTKIATLYVTQTTGMASDAVTDNRTVLTIIGDGGSETPDPGDYPVTLDQSKDKYIYYVNSNAARTINLPAPAVGFQITFVDKDGLMGTNALTVGRDNSSETINGVAQDFLCESNHGIWKFTSDGVGWFVN
jgi:hypothetical protein